MTSGLIVEDIGDHLSIFTLCKILNIATSEQPIYTYRRKLNDETKSNLCEALDITTWESVLDECDIDTAYNKFTSLFTKK